MARTVEDRRQNLLCSYYTECDPIRTYMIARLSATDGLRVLEPSAGDGAFVKALLDWNPDLCVCCIDKDPEAIQKLAARFGHRVRAAVADTILDTLDGENGVFRRLGLAGRFDRIIGNPPYGGWLD